MCNLLASRVLPAPEPRGQRAEAVQETVLGQLAIHMGKLTFILISLQSEMNLLWIIELKTSELKR